MSQQSSIKREADKRATQASQASQDAGNWFETAARFGYMTKGVVYFIIGILAVQVALGTGGRTTGSSGTFQTIASQPFGMFLLIAVGVGLLAYALWRFVQAAFDPEHKGDDLKGLATRVGYAVSGVIYGGLAWTALQVVMGSGGGGGGNSTQSMTARLMSQPFGVWLVGIAGAIVIGLGFYQIYKGYKAKFLEKMNLNEMSQTEETWATRLGRIGLIARGVVYEIIGIFLLVAAWQTNPQQARGLEGVLDTLLQQPFGPWLLGLIAIGLMAYGIFMGVMGRYRHISAA